MQVVRDTDVGEALARLEPRDRDIVILIAWQDLTYEQVAQALAIPVGTVRSRLHRARERLRESLAPSASATEKGKDHDG